MPEVPVGATLCDYKQENVDALGPSRRGIRILTCNVQRSDAFDRALLAAIEPRATIGIVSGLYELFPSNDAVLIR